MQLITFLKQLLVGGMKEDLRVENSMERLSVITLKEYMLFEGNFNKDLKRLYSLGLPSYQPSDLEERPELRKLPDKKLWDTLCNLHCLLEAWEDSGLIRGSVEENKQRHAFKYKKDLAKPTRKTIHKALYVEVIHLAKELKHRAEDRIKNSENIAALNKRLTIVEANEKSGSQLIELASECLRVLKTMDPDLKSPEAKDIEKRFKKAAKAITSFKTLPQKIIAALSVSVAVIAALACGFFTGGAIYALIAGALLPGVVIPIVVIAGLIGFAVNGRFFSKSLPEFLVKLTNLSRITEFINERGERKQFSNLKKYVYLPFAAIFSVAVGISFAAFSMVQLAGMLVALPFLAATGPLPIILAAVLAITMTIVMFKAFVEIAPKLSFSQLWQSLKTAWKEMSFMKFLFHGVTLAVCAMGVFGLFMACHTGLPTLVNIFGQPAAILVLMTSFVGQLPFNMLTVSTFCKVVGSFLMSVPGKVKNLFRQAPAQATEAAEKPALLNKIASAGLNILGWVAMPVLLIINAVANGLTLLSGTPSIPKYVGAGAGALNSISGNLVSDNDTQERSQADNAAIKKLKAALASNNNTQEKSQVDNAPIRKSENSKNPEVSEVDKTLTDSRAKASRSDEDMLRAHLAAALPFFMPLDQQQASVSSSCKDSRLEPLATREPLTVMA